MTFASVFTRITVFVPGIVCGWYAASAAFRNGQLLGTTTYDSLVFGSAFAAVVVGSWGLPVLAKLARDEGSKGLSRTLMTGWSMCLLFVLVNAIGYTAYHRHENVGEKVETIKQYNRAESLLSITLKKIEMMKNHPSWESSAGCTNDTIQKSIDFCNELRAEQVKVAKAREILKRDRPNSGDAQAETLAFAMGNSIKSEIIGKGLPIFTAVVLELAVTLFVYAALVPMTSGPNAVKGVKVEPVVPEQPQIKRGPGRPKGSKNKKSRKRRKSQKRGRLANLDPKLADAFYLDGRKARGIKSKIAND